MSGLRDELPWETISAHVLEELLYSLVGEMGAIEREWRSSPGSINTADGGRDIEATFEIPSADGGRNRKRWWIDAKRRKKSVTPSDVKEVALNSLAAADVEALIIATNSTFTNPTRDWVKEFNKRTTGPVVQLWDRVTLQDLLDRYPAAAAAKFFEALGLHDRVEFLTDYFFRCGRVLSEEDLRWAWSVQEEVNNGSFLTAAAYSEMSIGDIGARPWGTLLDSRSSFEALVCCHTALPYSAGQKRVLSWDRSKEVAAYMTAQVCRNLSVELVGKILETPFSFLANSSENPPSLVEFTDSVLRAVVGELLDACSDDCARMVCGGDFHDVSVDRYWRRYTSVAEIRPDEESLILENCEEPCVVGFSVDLNQFCPLNPHYIRIENADDRRRMVDVIKRVINFRVENPTDQYRRYAQRLDWYMRGLNGKNSIDILNDLPAFRRRSGEGE
ncbi:restriction endonuclease [Kibdelosporangium aridum]|uniref:restriction endonuclease n=1 Tax=Kibdelosporangium aridum TaxID=2030 RepID=UPI0035EACEA5